LKKNKQKTPKGFYIAVISYFIGGFTTYHLMIAEVDLTIFRIIFTTGGFAVGYFLFSKVIIEPISNAIRKERERAGDYVKREW
jgi:hypothetical protein